MTYLTSHGKTYYFRLFVPTDLQRVLGRKVIKKSLKTGNKRTALRLALKIQSAIHPYLQAITENTIMIDPHRLKECLNSYFHKIIDNDESMRAYPSLKPLTISDLGDKDIQFDTNIQFVDAKSPKQSTGRFINKEIDYLKHENEHIENNIEYIDDIIASQFCCKNDDRRTLSRIFLTEMIKTALKTTNNSEIISYIDDFFKSSNIKIVKQSEEINNTIAENSHDYHKICRNVLLTILDAHRVCDARDEFDIDLEDRIKNKYTKAQNTQPAKTLETINIAEATAKLVAEELRKYTPCQLREASDLYFSSANRNNSSKRRATIEKERMIIDEFIQFSTRLNATSTSDINHDLCSNYIYTLERTPSNYTKLFPGKDIYELAQQEHKKTLHDRTINDRKGTISSFFKFLISKGKLETNFMESKFDFVAPKETTSEIYTNNDLYEIFNSRLYTSDKINKSFKFWFIPLALFTGCRLAELCQLRCKDVIKLPDKDIWYLNITASPEDSASSLKNEAAKRCIPLHPTIINDLGFIKYVERQIESGRTRVFHDTKPRDDIYGKDVSQWYNDTYITKINLDPPTNPKRKKTFHSLRATSMRIAKLALCDGMMRSEYFGHTITDDDADYRPVSPMTQTHYPGKYSVELLYEHVTLKMSLPVDISHLTKCNYCGHNL